MTRYTGIDRKRGRLGTMLTRSICIFIGVVIVGVLAKWVAMRQQPSHLGFVSQHWVTEHRLAENSDHG